MLAKINTLYLKGLPEKAIIEILSKPKKRGIKLSILWKKRSREAVRKLRLSHVEKCKPLSKKDLFRAYKKEVWKITCKQPLHTLENHDLRGFRNHHLDHIISIWDGFHEGIAPEIIGDISNLRFVHYKDNMLKGRKSIR